MVFKFERKSTEKNVKKERNGAGASIYHQQDSLVKTVPTSWWHPENWQTYYHIENWKTISSRPYVWGSFVWISSLTVSFVNSR